MDGDGSGDDENGLEGGGGRGEEMDVDGDGGLGDSGEGLLGMRSGLKEGGKNRGWITLQPRLTFESSHINLCQAIIVS